MERTHTSLKTLPDKPGVYFFVGPRKEILYVGKATSLRDRVKSYFASDVAAARGERIVSMVTQARRIDYRITDSVLEALILEAKLIQELKPRYNVDGKDDKSWNYVLITMHEVFPRVIMVRGKDVPVVRERMHRASGTDTELPVYGPFVHAGQLYEALKIVRKIFPYYDTKRPVAELLEKRDTRVRFNEAIGTYPHAGTTPEVYAQTIRHIRLFFEGKKSELVRSLTRAMKRAAKAQAFEEAQTLKKQIDALLHIRDISLLKRHDDYGALPKVRIEAYDVAHLGGAHMVGVMTVVEDGEARRAAYRSFSIRSVTQSNDTAALKEILTRRLAHTEWTYPRLIVVDGSTAQIRVAERVLVEHGIVIPVVAVVKDEHHRPREIKGSAQAIKGREQEVLLANSEAHRFALARHTAVRRKKLTAP